MKKHGVAVLMLGILLVLTHGCGLSASLEPGTATQPPTAPATKAPLADLLPSPIPPATAPPSPTPAGAQVSANGIEFVIPSDLGTAASAEIVPEVVMDSPGPNVGVAPAHVQFTLQGYPNSGAPTANQPTLMVYPAQEYAKVNQRAAKSLEKLYAILTPPFTPLAKDAMPNLSVYRGLAMASNMKTIAFQSGSGVRMLAFYSQGYGPITNDSLAYNYHGVTTDGKYYVIAILPISAPFLQSDFKSPLPEGGIPFPEDMYALEAYIDQVAARLEAAEADNILLPAIASLDALIASLKLTSASILLPTPLPTSQPQPTATSPAACNDAAEFVKDVTIPDGTAFKPNERFIKTWQLKNTGDCTWNPDYRMVFTRGDQMSGPAEAPLTAGNFVSPGAFVDVSVELQAPDKDGSYTGYWAVRNAAGQILPVARTEKDQFYVQIYVGTQGFQVTNASVRWTYVSGPIGQLCTWAQYTLYATVSANGPGVVTYQWLGSGSVLQTSTLTFNEAGKQIVEFILSGPFAVPTVMNISFATDKPDRTWSPVQITCNKD